MPRLIFVCAPLTSFGDVARNLQHVSLIAADIVQEGNIPIIPHWLAIYTGVSGAGDEHGRSLALSMLATLSFLSIDKLEGSDSLSDACIGVWGPTHGRGIREEVLMARLLGLSVEFNGLGPWESEAHEAGIAEQGAI